MAIEMYVTKIDSRRFVGGSSGSGRQGGQYESANKGGHRH